MASRVDKPHRRPFSPLAGAAFFLILVVVGLGGGFLAALVASYSPGLPDVESLRTYQPSGTTRIFAANGELIATLFKENRTWIPLKDVPICMRQAIVASEDARFYQHRGVDPVGMARALWWVARSHGLSQGASTITMQLARRIFLNDDLTPRRKIQEMLVALQLERKFTKDQLLEFYLNQIYFGAGAYGVEAAAQTYFGKKASALQLADAALIVGVVPAPSDYSPFVNLKLARERQALVLRRMVEVGYIRPDEARSAQDEPLRLATPRKDPFVLKYPYFATYVLAQLVQKYGEEALYRAGLNVYTTLDPTLQIDAQEAVARGLREAGAWQHIGQAALVAIEPQTGAIKAMVGGTGWSPQSQFNRAYQAQRSAGSSFKIFVYATALENGFSPDTVVPDSPVTFHLGPNDDWTPKNSDGRFMGAIPLRTALRFSRNPVSARLVDRLTPARVVDLAYKMGIHSHIDPLLSIALGAVAVSPLDMASALGTLADGGKRVEPIAVRLIRDSEGNVVEDNRRPVAQQVLSSRSAFALTEMMVGAVESGTGTAARLRDRPAAGKTGTTDEHRDAWFCGFVPRLAAAVWVGNDDNSRMTGTYGGDVPAPIWRHFMEAALANRPVEHFGADAHGQVLVAMCRDSHRRANATCPDLEMKPFFWKEVPQRFCTLHTFANTVSTGHANAASSGSAGNATPGASASPTDEPEATPEDDSAEPPAPASTSEPPATSPENPPVPVPPETPLRPAGESGAGSAAHQSGSGAKRPAASTPEPMHPAGPPAAAPPPERPHPIPAGDGPRPTPN